MSTIFTRIVNREIPAFIIAEDENYLAFLDINPLAEGHTLVIPKQEIDYLFDADDQLLAGMMIFAKKVARGDQANQWCANVSAWPSSVWKYLMRTSTSFASTRG
jgi:histidine triad (HIT) family protein